MIKDRIVQFCNWWGNLKFLPFIGITLLLTYYNAVALIPLNIYSSITNTKIPMPTIGEREEIYGYMYHIDAIFIAPVLETLLFINLIIFLMRKLITKNYIIQTFVSIICFGLWHIHLGWRYFLYATLVGVVLTVGYLIYRDKKGIIFATYAIIFVHSLRNAISSLLYHIIY